jgi:hypothetical protein
MGVATVSTLGPWGWSSCFSPRHVSISAWGAALSSLLAVLLLALVLVRTPPERPPHTEASNLSEFVEHLRLRGVQLYVVSRARQGGGPDRHLYLTEDPTATWDALASKARLVERLHQWRGTVCVESQFTGLTDEVAVDQWGVNGCRIGNFVLFGDDRVLRRIEDACR